AFLRVGKLVASGDPAAMRREHDDRRLLRLSVPISRGSHEKVAEALRAWPKVERVSPFGSAFHVRTRESVAPEAITQYLASKGLEPDYVHPIRPSLEDVFLKLVERDTK